MTRLKYIVLFALIFPFGTIYAQDQNYKLAPESNLKTQIQKLRWDMNLGMAYSFIPGYSGGMNYYAAPGFTYPIDNRFAFHGGIITGFTTSPFPLYGESAVSDINSGFTSIYGSVSYQLNQSVVFYGTGVKSIATYGPPTPFYQPGYDEISFGSSIRLGDNVTIGASVHFRDYNSAGNNFYSPFFQDK